MVMAVDLWPWSLLNPSGEERNRTKIQGELSLTPANSSQTRSPLSLLHKGRGKKISYTLSCSTMSSPPSLS
jgi:hypothetical protein